MISVLTVTTLFPNPEQPAHGAFVATRLKELLRTGAVTAEVIAPVPWLPPGGLFPTKGRLDRVPRSRRDGELQIHHPRYLVIPKVGMNLAPSLLYRSLKREFSSLLKAGKRFDLIDAHYFYPDGVAAARLASEFGLPLVITARGTDLNLIPDFEKPRKQIVRASRRADGLITVCDALRSKLVELAPGVKVEVLRNGVDLVRFRPVEREVARRALAIKRRTIASVGLLIERKGHHLVIEALTKLPDTDLLIVGEGPDGGRLKRLVAKLGLRDRVRFLGLIDQRELPTIYSAADALVLASSREGWANVLLEAMACGTPVVASAIWGTPEVVAAPEAGVLVHSRDAEGIAQGISQLFANYPERSATRRYAEQFSWDETTRGQLDLFREILARYEKRPE